MNVTEKTGKLISAITLTEEDLKLSQLILISKDGQTIKVSLSSLRVTGRVTQGVILTRIRGKEDMLVRASVVRQADDEE